MGPINGDVLLQCKLSRGGFSGERVFNLETSDGELVGLAGLRYCRNQKGGPLKPDEPEPGKPIAGGIVARVLSDLGNDLSLVSVPSGDVVRVAKSAFVKLKSAGASPDVSFQP